MPLVLLGLGDGAVWLIVMVCVGLVMVVAGLARIARYSALRLWRNPGSVLRPVGLLVVAILLLGVFGRCGDGLLPRSLDGYAYDVADVVLRLRARR